LNRPALYMLLASDGDIDLCHVVGVDCGDPEGAFLRNPVRVSLCKRGYRSLDVIKKVFNVDVESLTVSWRDKVCEIVSSLHPWGDLI